MDRGRLTESAPHELVTQRVDSYGISVWVGRRKSNSLQRRQHRKAEQILILCELSHMCESRVLTHGLVNFFIEDVDFYFLSSLVSHLRRPCYVISCRPDHHALPPAQLGHLHPAIVSSNFSVERHPKMGLRGAMIDRLSIYDARARTENGSVKERGASQKVGNQ